MIPDVDNAYGRLVSLSPIVLKTAAMICLKNEEQKAPNVTYALPISHIQEANLLIGKSITATDRLYLTSREISLARTHRKALSDDQHEDCIGVFAGFGALLWAVGADIPLALPDWAAIPDRLLHLYVNLPDNLKIRPRAALRKMAFSAARWENILLAESLLRATQDEQDIKLATTVLRRATMHLGRTTGDDPRGIPCRGKPLRAVRHDVLLILLANCKSVHHTMSWLLGVSHSGRYKDAARPEHPPGHPDVVHP